MLSLAARILLAALGAAQDRGPETAALVPPPEALQALPGHTSLRLVPLREGDRFVECRVSLSTRAREVSFFWTAAAGSAAHPASEYQTESLEFYPTAYTPSWNSANVLYVGGTGAGSRSLVERWTLGSSTLQEKDEDGTPVTRFLPPAILRQQVPVDPSLGAIADMTVNPWPAGGSSEELWILDWDTRNVYATDPSTGTKALRIPSHGNFCTISLRRHSLHGAVWQLVRRPFFIGAMEWTRMGGGTAAHGDANTILVYDRDLDGTLDGEFDVQWESLSTSPPFDAGSFSTPWDS